MNTTETVDTTHLLPPHVKKTICNIPSYVQEVRAKRPTQSGLQTAKRPSKQAKRFAAIYHKKHRAKIKMREVARFIDETRWER
jgi:hypothetical protein